VTTLYRETSGSGPPLVLLHGWGMNLRLFDDLRARLAPHYTVTALDLPGHGRSPWQPELSPAQQLSSIAAQLPPEALLVGWSLGGQLALQLAAGGALPVRGLVLMASTPRFLRSADWPHGLPAVVLERFAAELERDPQRVLADFLLLQVRGSAEAETVLAALQRALETRAAAPALAAGLAMLRDNDLRELARGLQVPTLVIAGQYDRVTPPAAARALVQLLPQGRLLMLPRAGHAPFLSHPRAVLEALLAPGDIPGGATVAAPTVSSSAAGS
jgi:pimeloyl-[acyl-carrier protein] methyl ester esterase